MREKPLLLPAPRVDQWQWQLSARCRRAGIVEVFDSEDPGAMSAAKEVCLECPVLEQCRDHAVTANEPHGVWGALTPLERALYKWTHGTVTATKEYYRVTDAMN